MDNLSHLGGWADLPFFRERWASVKEALDADPRETLPPERVRFAALERTQPDDVRVVILGQDPYPTPGHATGLAFSVADGVRLPASLRNVFREMETDLGGTPVSGDLSHWADAGVLLMNTSLSVPAGVPGGHAKLGWRTLTENVLERLSDRPRAFILWGKPAQAFRGIIGDEGHLFIESPHPSPLSAHRGFLGSRPFSRVNEWLLNRGEKPIDWIGTDFSSDVAGATRET